MRAFLLLALLSIASVALADDFSAERPGFTSGIGTLPQGHSQLEVGYTYLRQGGSFLHRVGDGPLVRLGEKDQTEFRLTLPTFFLSRTAGTTHRDSSDAGLGYKKRLGATTSVTLSSTLPSTGSPALRESHLQPSLEINDERSFGQQWTLQKNLIYTSARQGGTRYDALSAAVNLGYAISPKLATFIEGYVLNRDAPGGERVYFIDSGITLQHRENIQLDLNGGLRLNGSSPRDYFFGFGYVVRS